MADDMTIMVIDDQVESLQWLHQLLSQAGYRVLVANSAELALKSLEQALPSLILLDVRMPEMDGFELCRRIKARLELQAIPIIFLSALGETEDRIKGFELGAVDFIHKPFNETETLLRVSTHCRLNQLHHRLESLVDERTMALQDALRQQAAAEAELRQALERNQVLFRELQHRAKNSFGMIAAMVQLQAQHCRGTEAKELAERVERRVRTVSELYASLYQQGEGAAVELSGYFGKLVQAQLGPAAPHRLDTRFAGVAAAPEKAVVLGLILVELLTNTLKHAYPAGQAGAISIALERSPAQLCLDYRDDGKGMAPPADGALGSGLGLIGLLCRQLDASLDFDPPPGFHARIVLPF